MTDTPRKVYGAKFPTQHLEVPGGSIAYDDTGEQDKPLVIAVSGMGEMRGQFRYLRPQLQEAGYRVVTMDLRGHGDSSVQWDDYSARAIGTDIVALINKLGASSATVIGGSYGGSGALWAAHDAPDKVNSLVLIDSPLGKPFPLLDKMFVNAGLNGPWGAGMWISHWDDLFVSGRPDDHEQYKAALTSKYKDEKGRVAAFRKLTNSPNNGYTAITANPPKALVIMGEKDKDYKNPSAEAKEMAEKLGAELWILKDTGHYPHVERHTEVVPRIVDFVTKAQDRNRENPSTAQPNKNNWSTSIDRESGQQRTTNSRYT